MASIIREPNGRRQIEFFDHEGDRKRVRLGEASHKHAEAVRTRIDRLIASKVTGNGIDRDMAPWLAARSASCVHDAHVYDRGNRHLLPGPRKQRRQAPHAVHAGRVRCSTGMESRSLSLNLPSFRSTTDRENSHPQMSRGPVNQLDQQCPTARHSISSGW